jgi:hypothetical protein
MLPPNSTAASRNLVPPSGIGANAPSPNLGSQSNSRVSEADWMKLGPAMQNQGPNCDGASGTIGGSNLGPGRQSMYSHPLALDSSYGDFAKDFNGNDVWSAAILRTLIP